MIYWCIIESINWCGLNEGHTIPYKAKATNQMWQLLLQFCRSEGVKKCYGSSVEIYNHIVPNITLFLICLCWFNPSAETEIFHINQVITMVVDALVPRIPRPSAAMILNTGLTGPCLPGGIISPACAKSVLKKDSKCKYLCFLNECSTCVNIPLQSHRFSWSRGTAFQGWSVEQRNKNITSHY